MKLVAGLVVAACVALGLGQDAPQDKAEKFFLANSSTTTMTTTAWSILTVPATCYFTNSPKDCSGRKLRRHARQISLDESGVITSLDDSMDGKVNGPGERTGEEIDGKFFFTVWKTSTSTLILTTSTANAITVSASVYCTVAGYFTGPIC